MPCLFFSSRTISLTKCRAATLTSTPPFRLTYPLKLSSWLLSDENSTSRVIMRSQFERGVLALHPAAEFRAASANVALSTGPGKRVVQSPRVCSPHDERRRIPDENLAHIARKLALRHDARIPVERAREPSNREPAAQLSAARDSARSVYRGENSRLVKIRRIVLHSRNGTYLRRHLLSAPASCNARETRLRKAPRRWHRLSRLPTPWRTVHQAGTARNILRAECARKQFPAVSDRNQAPRYILGRRANIHSHIDSFLYGDRRFRVRKRISN